MTLIPRRDNRASLVSFAILFNCALAIVAVHQTANAGIVSFSGVVPLAGPPLPMVGGVFPGAQEPTTLPIVFPEVLNGIVGPNGLPVDHDGSALGLTVVTSGNVVNPLLINTTIPAGRHFDSYLFHFDPSANSTPFYGVASVTFDAKIIGVQVFTQNATGLRKPSPTSYVGKLEAGDAEVAANGGPSLAYYPGTSISRGLEEDSLGIASGGFEIRLQGLAGGSEVDQVRILVEAVPEPTSFVVAVMGLMGLYFSCITRVERIGRS